MSALHNDLTVLKFGGTSVATPERMNTIADICLTFPRSLVVLSALSGTTDNLLKIGRAATAGDEVLVNQEIGIIRNRHLAFAASLIQDENILNQLIADIEKIIVRVLVLCTSDLNSTKMNELGGIGEFLSTNLFHALLQQRGIRTELLNSPDFVVLKVDDEPDMGLMTSRFQQHFAGSEARVTVMQGFVCRNSDGEVTSFTRGGSDYSATLAGAALQAAEIQIWTDIDGMQTADPRIVANTQPVRVLNYAEAAELAYFGAKILHPLTIYPAAVANIPVRLKNTLSPESQGTVIGDFPHEGSAVALAVKKNITAIKIRSSRMLNAYGYLASVFEIFAKYKTSIDLITTSEVAVSVTIDNTTNLESIVAELNELGSVDVEPNLAVISVVGYFPVDRSGDAFQVFGAVKHIPVRMISYGGSEHNISLLVEDNNANEAMSALHHSLFVKD